ncbi:nuclear pore complex protein Nup155-like [Centruroides sculpturatus]|uniref:nuclear pore complex protein Nup155-like n=1 Tax=Centruroides sculpturatus TaxID=218467 RepID=UPI000C6D009A|nr:nuclear pore complex protein Nup155-like [Centruroides sculpturatus]
MLYRNYFDHSLIYRTIDRSHFHPIVHISSVELPESFLVHLVAITQTGVRLYFTTTSLIHPEIRPVTLSLLHVRLPPGFSANAPPDRPSNVHLAHYRKGTALLASARNDDSDILWAMSNDTFPFQPILMEIHTILPITGRTWAMAEVPILQPPKPFCPMVFNNINVYTEPPLLVTQHMEYPRQFVLLSDIPQSNAQSCRLKTMSNELELPNQEQVQIKKLVQKEKRKKTSIRIGTLNIGTLNGKSRELVDLMQRRRVHIVPARDKMERNKAKELGEAYKLFVSGVNKRGRNGVGIIIDKVLKDSL